MPIGILDEASFEELSIQLEPRDRLYFYSDGITEATNDRGEMLQPDGLIRFLLRSRSRPLNDAIEQCVQELKRWCGPVPFADDVSLLALEMPAAV
jgi:sigma-B regulation protein RsbU (phosphoserine phosphatase)